MPMMMNVKLAEPARSLTVTYVHSAGPIDSCGAPIILLNFGNSSSALLADQ